MVKHTLSTIPIYLFLVFRAPRYFVDKIHSIIIRYLRGKGDGGGISSMKWVNLCKPMSEGGLGLRDLDCFNQALLAKTACRLFEDKNSLLAQVLLGKYCSNKDFFMVKPVSGCSWGWRSILWGRDLLLKGLNS